MAWDLSNLLTIPIASVFLLIFLISRSKLVPSSLPPETPINYPVFGSPQFFSSRHKFVLDSSKISPIFSFRLFRIIAVCLTGEEGRKWFHEKSGLDLIEGSNVLYGKPSS
jgi:hypothetical protein